MKKRKYTPIANGMYRQMRDICRKALTETGEYKSIQINSHGHMDLTCWDDELIEMKIEIRLVNTLESEDSENVNQE